MTDQRKHYASLDGLRGFAAISVVIYHIGQFLGAPALAANAWLAVDLFFCLSGFVLSLAYSGRLIKCLTRLEFCKLRLIRLMPLILLGLVIGGLYALAKAQFMHEEIDLAPFAMAVLLAMLNLPYFGAPAALGGPLLFPLNGPQYTLFLEFAANIMWSLLNRAHDFQISIAVAATGLCMLASFGFGGDETSTFWSGFPRVAASFFAGVAIYHIDRRIGSSRCWPFVFWGLTAAMAVIFFLPVRLSPTFDLFWVAACAPLQVLAGARTEIPKGLRRLALFGGSVSYAVYALHVPIFCWVNGLYQATGLSPSIVAETPLILGSVIGVSAIATKCYDEPLRRLLNRAWLRADQTQDKAITEGVKPSVLALD